jgi:hypothetical protein
MNKRHIEVVLMPQTSQCAAVKENAEAAGKDELSLTRQQASYEDHLDEGSCGCNTCS